MPGSTIEEREEVTGRAAFRVAGNRCMSREEFLQILRSKLSGELEESQIQAHIRYYDQYITEKMSKGRSEEEVTAMLGDPRLIAKTLIDTSEREPEAYSTIYEEPEEGQEQVGTHRVWGLDLSTWYGKVLMVLIAIAILALVVTVLSALLPFLAVILLVSIAVRYLRKR